jgi:hypothetical protein
MRITIERQSPAVLRPGAPAQGVTYLYHWIVDQPANVSAAADQGAYNEGWATSLSAACTAVQAITEIAGP